MFTRITDWISGFIGNAASRIIPAVLLLAVGIAAVHLIMSMAAKALNKSKLDKAAHRLVLAVIRVLLFVLLGFSVAAALGIDMTGTVALASVLTLAVSLSLQNALSNVFGGFSLLYNKPFTIGDVVEVAGQTGSVKEIGLTYTKLITPDNKTISIPNSAVSAAQIVNYTTIGTRRVDITVTASYDAPVQLVREALLEAADYPTALKEPAPFAGVSSYDDSAISYVLQVWCSSGDYVGTLFGINQRIKEVFDEKNIEMTYPHLNVHLQK